MKRFLMALLALCLVCHIALADFSPGLKALSQNYEQDKPLALHIVNQHFFWDGLSEASLSSLQGWLQERPLLLTIAQSGWDMSLLRVDEPFVTLSQRQLPAGSLLSLHPPGGLWQGDDDAVSQLLGQVALPDWLALKPEAMAQRLFQALPELYQLLSAHEKLSRVNTNIRHVGRSRQRADYRLSAADWQALWPRIAPALTERLPQAAELLDSLRFEGPGRLSRFMDADGKDMGLQYTGNISAQGLSARKLTLLLGFQPDAGLWLSLKAPALKGRDNISLQFGYALGEKKAARSLTGEFSLSQQKGSDKTSQKASLVLESQMLEGSEQLRGELWLEQARSDRLSIKPDICFEDGIVRGAVQLTQQSGRKKTLDIALDILTNAPPALAVLPDQAPTALDSPQALAAARAALGQGLMPIMLDLIAHTPPENRRMLLHELGRDRRAQGGGLPALQDLLTDGTNFMVMDEPAKEDTP